MVVQTEYEFTLPTGFVDENGNLHKKGVMRLAKAADEILPLSDLRAKLNPAYATIIVLSRVITTLGDLKAVTTKTIEELFASDLAYLQLLYNKMSGEGKTTVKVTCPKCKNEFSADVSSPRE